MEYAVACLSSQARVHEILSRKLQVCKVLGGGSSIFQVVHLLISMDTYRTCDFPRGCRSRPPAFIRIRTSFFKTFFTYLPTYATLHGYIKFSRDKSHDIWRLELGKVKNTTFLMKSKFLFLRTIKDVLMKLTYVLLRKQRTHNLRYIVRTLLMKLAPGVWIFRINCIVLLGID